MHGGQELMTGDTVHLRGLTRQRHFLSVALDTSLLGRLEDMDPVTVTIDTVRHHPLIEEMSFMAGRLGYLRPPCARALEGGIRQSRVILSHAF